MRGYFDRGNDIWEIFEFLIKNKGYSFIEFRSKMGLSKTYLVDIQKEITYLTPEMQMQMKMVDLLNLSVDEETAFLMKHHLAEEKFLLI